MTRHLIELLRASRSPDGESVKMFSQVSFSSLSPQPVNFYLTFNSGTEVMNSPATAVAHSDTGSLCLGENLYFPLQSDCLPRHGGGRGNNNKRESAH